MPTADHHPTWSLPYRARASLPDTPLLTRYLLKLIHVKKSNLCISADVSTTSELLSLAEETGDSICILKTHYDIINDFTEKTVRELRKIAKRRHFLIFEDRKFGDIGSTVQKQYTQGPFAVAKWAEIVNCHVFPGPAIVTALEQAAASAISEYNSSVQTDISVGSPVDSPTTVEPDHEDYLKHGGNQRKESVVSVTHTISTQTEPMSPQATHGFDDETSESLGECPYLRALLLLAEMSSEGNFCTGSYTDACVDIARQHKSFVMGFIAQRSLNTQQADNFITMTPGVNLPPEGQGDVKGDGLGQQYNTPWNIIFEKGADVVIVGRGIIKADNRYQEAERYRKEAWRSYEARVKGNI